MKSEVKHFRTMCLSGSPSQNGLSEQCLMNERESLCLQQPKIAHTTITLSVYWIESMAKVVLVVNDFKSLRFENEMKTYKCLPGYLHVTVMGNMGAN